MPTLLGSHTQQERKVEKAFTSQAFFCGAVTIFCMESINRTSTPTIQRKSWCGVQRRNLSSALMEIMVMLHETRGDWFLYIEQNHLWMCDGDPMGVYRKEMVI